MIEEATECGYSVHIPRQLNRYIYIETIGIGVTSVVCLFEDSASHRRFAGKFVPRCALADPLLLKLFERELRIFQRLNHPNICKVEEVIYLRDSICVIMEHCPCGDLLEFLTTHKYVMPCVKRRMFYELCNAVAYLHSRDIAHRDLKPENVFLDADLHVKLGDFGLAHETKSGELLGTLCGTLFYSAPELLEANEYDGKKTDIWALGLILFCMQMLALPWRDSSVEGVKQQIKKADIDIPASMAKQIADVIRSCCVLDPKARPDVNEILKMPWLQEEERMKSKTARDSFVRPAAMHQAMTQRIVIRRIWTPKTRQSALLSMAKKPQKLSGEKEEEVI